jgi:hypothetical protein
VSSLSGDFAATNPSLGLDADGVRYGPLANAGAVGSLFYAGANGLTLADITALSYTITHNSSDDSPISSPYFRLFTEGDTHDVIFDPTECATEVPAENVATTFDVIAGTPTGTLRYDDDPCGPGAVNTDWATIVAEHGDEVISGIYITLGGAGGHDLSALLTDLTVNDDTFVFSSRSSAPAPVTIISNPPAAVNRPLAAVSTSTQASQRCTGNIVRVIRAPRRAGERFLSTRASLRGRRLSVRGRQVRVDLRSRSEGVYNVRLSSRYRKANGKVRVSRTTRTLSVACS